MTCGARLLVVGLGHPDRGDDAAGLLVAERVRKMRLTEVRAVTAAAALDLLEAWRGHDHVVVVDAVRRAPGDTGDRPWLVDLVSEPLHGCRAAGGTHDLGLADVVRLARLLDRLPERLTLVGVPASRVELGTGLSAGTRRAVERAVDAVVACCRQLRTTTTAGPLQAVGALQRRDPRCGRRAP